MIFLICTRLEDGPSPICCFVGVEQDSLSRVDPVALQSKHWWGIDSEKEENTRWKYLWSIWLAQHLTHRRIVNHQRWNETDRVRQALIRSFSTQIRKWSGQQSSTGRGGFLLRPVKRCGSCSHKGSSKKGRTHDGCETSFGSFFQWETKIRGLICVFVISPVRKTNGEVSEREG